MHSDKFGIVQTLNFMLFRAVHSILSSTKSFQMAVETHANQTTAIAGAGVHAIECFLMRQSKASWSFPMASNGETLIPILKQTLRMAAVLANGVCMEMRIYYMEANEPMGEAKFQVFPFKTAI